MLKVRFLQIRTSSSRFFKLLPSSVADRAFPLGHFLKSCFLLFVVRAFLSTYGRALPPILSMKMFPGLRLHLDSRLPSSSLYLPSLVSAFHFCWVVPSSFMKLGVAFLLCGRMGNPFLLLYARSCLLSLWVHKPPFPLHRWAAPSSSIQSRAFLPWIASFYFFEWVAPSFSM
jgi:hypothetical protein